MRSIRFHWTYIELARREAFAREIGQEKKTLGANGRFGRFLRDVTVFRVKPPAASNDPFDFLEPVRVIPAAEAFRPLKEGGCSFVD